MKSLLQQLVKQQTASKNLLKAMERIAEEDINDASKMIFKDNINYLEK